MKIVTTPMCEEILKIVGISDYKVKKFPTKEDGDLAILLSESKTDMESIYLKLNTFKQIKNSVEKVGKRVNKSPIVDFSDCEIASKYLNKEIENTTKVKVYSNFLKDIVEDMGFIITDRDYDYAVVPDYLIEKVDEDKPIIKIPSHSSVSLNPIERAYLRYKILEDFINK